MPENDAKDSKTIGRPPLELLSYITVVGVGAITFFAHAEPTLQGIAVAGLKLLVLALAMGAVTTLAIRARRGGTNGI